MSHSIVKCSGCDKTIRQCRCPSPTKDLTYEVCADCKAGLRAKKDGQVVFELVLMRGEGDQQTLSGLGIFSTREKALEKIPEVAKRNCAPLAGIREDVDRFLFNDRAWIVIPVTLDDPNTLCMFTMPATLSITR